MSRTVIRIEGLVNEADDTQVQVRPEEPSDVRDFGSPQLLACRADATPFSDLAAVQPGTANALPNPLVRTVGERIFQALAAHGGVLEALERARTAAANTVHPIYVASDVLDAEALPFEVLYHPTAEFLGLDPRWPIARIVGRRGTTVTRLLRPPLRLAAILAASDRDAIPEWEALRAAVQASRLPIAVTVFAGRDDLYDHIRQQGDTWATVEWVPTDVEALMNALGRLRPHLLHVFSHGSAQYQGSYLEIETRNVAVGDPPVYLAAQHLARLRDVVWLVTLNACEGAAPSAPLHSLAYMAADSGVPSAIGMREEIDAVDASNFCRAFYGAALSGLGAAVAAGGRFRPDWSEALRLARTALCHRIPGPVPVVASTSKPWTLPVLYRRADEFVVQVALSGLAISDDEQEKIFAQINMLEQMRDMMAVGTPADVLAAFEPLIAQARARLV